MKEGKFLSGVTLNESLLFPCISLIETGFSISQIKKIFLVIIPIFDEKNMILKQRPAKYNTKIQLIMKTI